MKNVRPLLILLLTATTACATITPPPSPESARISVALVEDKATAYDLTMVAFVDEGLTVAAGSEEPSLLVTVPVDIASGVYVTYRANIVAGSIDSRIVLTGTVRNEQGAAAGESLGGVRLDPGDAPLHNEMTGLLGEAWQRLERIADGLRE